MKRQRARLSLTELGENAILRQLVSPCRSTPAIPVGPGDDCAVIRIPGAHADILLKSDPVIEGIHFDRQAAPTQIGHKAIARALSDIAAMGGTPDYALVNLATPASTPFSVLHQIQTGIRTICRKYHVTVVGGDLSRGPVLSLNVFLLGHVPRNRAVLRSTAKPGDVLYVTGSLGNSIAGKHLTFQPRLNEGQWLGKNRCASAMMDLSDGLAVDLPRLLQASNAGAVLYVDALPLSPSLRKQPRKTAAQHALCDGEDYELLFTVPAALQYQLERQWKKRFRTPCTAIGRITTQKTGLQYRDAQKQSLQLGRKGFEHFA